MKLEGGRRKVRGAKGPPSLQGRGRRREAVRVRSSSSFESGEGVSGRHTLPSGLELETKYAKGVAGDLPPSRGKASLIHLHGSYHACWCWDNFFAYFASRGYDCYACSFLGQGSSSIPDGEVAGTVASHALDVRHWISTIEGPKVLVAHSFGGLIAQKLVATSPLEDIAAVALLCSVPPSGNGAMSLRFLRRQPVSALQLAYAFVTRNFETNADVCRQFFFSESLPRSDLLLYQSRMRESCNLPLLDVRAVSEELPVVQKSSREFEAFVCGTAADKVVDLDGVRETAETFGVEPVVFKSIAHDVMLDAGWEEVAESILAFLEGIPT
ncbi:alpha/beta hydrolase [Chloropicon primus]|uniref:Alpha/beta hydrolase n=1 Tax=Chloropicon primus TaxID=1764295 RepID=A0A5B8N1E3_9CHLO|nr:alpha/beta hydrolase [Chloropicon primus]|eukprot:QDZ25922.1 alpha/beta hydrolase [Chloropicon primus]